MSICFNKELYQKKKKKKKKKIANYPMFLPRPRTPKQANERSGARVKMAIETGSGRNPLLLLLTLL